MKKTNLINPIDNNTDMQMIPSGISGGTHFSDGIIFVYNIAGLDKELAAMGIKCTIPATMVDDQIVAVTDMIAGCYDCTGLHCQNGGAIGIGNIQSVMTGGVLAGNTDILAFTKTGSDMLFPVWVIERIAKPVTGSRGAIIDK